MRATKLRSAAPGDDLPSNTLAGMQGIDKWAQARGLCARPRHANFPALAGRGE
jgi:hypothetical protein